MQAFAPGRTEQRNDLKTGQAHHQGFEAKGAAIDRSAHRRELMAEKGAQALMRIQQERNGATSHDTLGRPIPGAPRQTVTPAASNQHHVVSPPPEAQQHQQARAAVNPQQSVSPTHPRQPGAAQTATHTPTKPAASNVSTKVNTNPAVTPQTDHSAATAPAKDAAKSIVEKSASIERGQTQGATELNQKVAKLEEKVQALLDQQAKLVRENELLKLDRSISKATPLGQRAPSEETIREAVGKIDPHGSRVPTAQEVLTHLEQAAKAKRQEEMAAAKDIAAKVKAQLDQKPQSGSVNDTQEWATKSLQFRETLSEQGKKVFDKMITLRYNKAQQTAGESYTDTAITPKDYFAHVVATQAIQKMESFVAVAENSFNSKGLLNEMRSLKLAPESLEIVKQSKVIQTADKLLMGNEHKEFTAILNGKPVEAAVYHLRDVIRSGEINTPAGRKELSETLKALKGTNLLQQVESEYISIFKRSLRKDATEALGKSAHTDAERLKKAAEQAEAAAKEAATRAELARKKLLEQEELVASFN